MTLTGIYDRLYAHLGPRGWWPAESPFEMIVGAILVQNVSWRNTEKAIANLKAAGLLTPAALHAAGAAEIEPLIRPAGYFRLKTRKLKAFLDHLWGRYGGDLGRMFSRPLPELRAELLGVYGIGPETCDCILCYAGGYPVMAMDAYTRRVFCRLGWFSDPQISYEAMQKVFHDALPADTRLRGEYHALLDALGSRICLKRAPRCGECPLQDICRRVGVEA